MIDSFARDSCSNVAGAPKTRKTRLPSKALSGATQCRPHCIGPVECRQSVHWRPQLVSRGKPIGLPGTVTTCCVLGGAAPHATVRRAVSDGDDHEVPHGWVRVRAAPSVAADLA